MNLQPENLVVSEDDFNKFVAVQVEWIKRELADKPLTIIPHLAIETVDMEGKRSVTLCAIAANFNTPAEKKNILNGLGRKIYEEQQLPLMIAFSSEAWMARNPPPGLAPSQCPDKREVIMIMAMDVTKTYGKAVSIPVNRLKDNRMEVAEDQVPEMNKGNGAKMEFPLLHHFFIGFAEAGLEKLGS